MGKDLLLFARRNSNEEKYKNAARGSLLANMKSLKNLDRLRRTSKIKNLNICDEIKLSSDEEDDYNKTKGYKLQRKNLLRALRKSGAGLPGATSISDMQQAQNNAML